MPTGTNSSRQISTANRNISASPDTSTLKWIWDSTPGLPLNLLLAKLIRDVFYNPTQLWARSIHHVAATATTSAVTPTFRWRICPINLLLRGFTLVRAPRSLWSLFNTAVGRITSAACFVNREIKIGRRSLSICSSTCADGRENWQLTVFISATVGCVRRNNLYSEMASTE